MLKGFIYTVILILGMSFHPFHVSVCDIEHNQETKTLEISARLFIDDLETGLKAFYKLESVDTYEPENPDELDSLIAGYLGKKLRISVDSKPVELEYLGSEVEGDARWCYIEVRGIEKVNSFEIENLILLESFEDQSNIVHVKANNKVKSYRLDIDKKKTTFTWK